MKPDYEIEYGSREWYLYHHYKNEKPVIPLILLSCFLMICKGGIWCVIVVWIIYFSWCRENNRILDNDPATLERRRLVMEAKERVKHIYK